MPIVVKPGEGKYFSQRAFDEVLIPFAELLLERGMPIESDINIFYDDYHDYSHCTFTANGKKFDVQYYKVLTYFMDGELMWSGCPCYSRTAFVSDMLEKAKKC